MQPALELENHHLLRRRLLWSEGWIDYLWKMRERRWQEKRSRSLVFPATILFYMGVTSDLLDVQNAPPLSSRGPRIGWGDLAAWGKRDVKEKG